MSHALLPHKVYTLVTLTLAIPVDSDAEAYDAVNDELNHRLYHGDFLAADWAIHGTRQASTGAEVEEGMLFRGESK